MREKPSLSYYSKFLNDFTQQKLHHELKGSDTYQRLCQEYYTTIQLEQWLIVVEENVAGNIEHTPFFNF